MTRKIVLINPHPPGHHGEEDISVLVQMPLNLAYLISLTPPGWEVDVIDENIELALDEKGQLTFGHADLVGLTAVTYQAPRAYDIAAVCRAQGIPTVMGGAHASTNTAEAQQHVDSVVVGDAEKAWEPLLQDLVAGRLQPQYAPGPLPLEELKVQPDREFLRNKYHYKYSSIVTTRGCPFLCDFCSVPIFQGRKYRQRPIEDVLQEMAQTSYQGLMLAEDNFYGYTPSSNQRARDLFKGMVQRGIWKDWFGFTSLNTCFDDELLEAMAASGCLGVLIGIESLNEKVLKSLKKHLNLKLGINSYREGIRNMHKHGLIVWGSVIFGNDQDSFESFEQMADFAMDVGVDVMTYGIWTPMPGTAGMQRMEKDQRIFRNNYPRDWYYYTSGHVVFTLKSMTLEQMITGLKTFQKKLYDRQVLRARLKRSLEETKNQRNAMFAFRINLDWCTVIDYNIKCLEQLYDSGEYPFDRELALRREA